MVVGLKYSWQFPVGYFLTGKSDADMQISLTNPVYKYQKSMECACGLKPVMELRQISTLRNLGFVFSLDYDKVLTNFKYPTSDYQFCTILEAYHMVKLAQNAPGDLKTYVQ